jgi:hypothetical protein
MIQDVAAVVAAAANTRGIGYQGQLVRLFLTKISVAVSFVLSVF